MSAPVTSSFADALLDQIISAEKALSEAVHHDGVRHHADSAHVAAEAANVVADLYRQVFRQGMGGFVEHVALSQFAEFRQQSRRWAAIATDLARRVA